MCGRLFCSGFHLHPPPFQPRPHPPRAPRRGYLLTQVLGGVWADKYGAKRVLGFGVVWWSLATVLTPLAAQISLPLLLVVRACMGIGEGVAMPAMNNMLSKVGLGRADGRAGGWAGARVGGRVGRRVGPLAYS